MQIVHEPPHKELTFFARAPLWLRVEGGADVEISEWCVSGVRKPEGLEIFPTRGTLCIPFQGIDLGFPVRLIADASGTFFAFEDLTVRQREVLSLFHANLLAGRMASTGDMITALDTPVDLVPMSETEEEKATATAGKPARLGRVICALVTYLAAAALIFGLLGQSIATRIISIPTVQARVVAPMVPHLATAPAYVDRVLVAVGDQVAQGDTLVRMSDPRREGRLDDARRAVKIAQDRLTEARALLRKHEATYPAVLESLEAQLDDALAYQDEVGPTEAGPFITSALAALEAFQNGASLQKGDYYDLHRDLITLRDTRKEELRQAKRAQGIAKSDARLLDIKAQAAGTIREVTAIEDLHVARGTPMVAVEENAPRVVRAWVDEAHLTRLITGQQARLRLPHSDGPQTHTGQVVEVTAGIDDSAAKRGFGLIVSVALPQDVTVPADMPVDLRIWRSWVPAWITNAQE